MKHSKLYATVFSSRTFNFTGNEKRNITKKENYTCSIPSDRYKTYKIMKTVCAVILEKGILTSIWSNYTMIFRKRRLWSDTNE